MSITTVTKNTGAKVESFTGCVVKTYGESVQVMSDIFEYHMYAVVYAADKGEFQTVFISSDYNGFVEETKTATVDATETVKALYEQHLAVKAAERALADAKKAMEEMVLDARRLERGKTVKVVKGRKVPVGTVGEVTWVGEMSFGGGHPKTRVGLRTLDGTVHWTAGSNVEVVVGG